MKKLLVTRNSPNKDELRELYLKEKDCRMKEHYHAIFLMHKLKNAKEAADIIGRDKSTILEWIKAFNDEGIDGLIRDSPPVRKSQLSQIQKEELKKDFLKNPRELGYDFSNWEKKSITYHIQNKFGIELCPSSAHSFSIFALFHKLFLYCFYNFFVFIFLP